MPQVAHEPSIHNPFPQLSKVAVAPFFNLSDEPTLDGRRVAIAYYNELQAIPGFEVVPVGVVERAIQDYDLTLRSPEDARRHTAPTIHRAWACKWSGMRPIRVFIPSRRVTRFPGARKTRKTFPSRWFSRPNWPWPRPSWTRRHRRAFPSRSPCPRRCQDPLDPEQTRRSRAAARRATVGTKSRLEGAGLQRGQASGTVELPPVGAGCKRGCGGPGRLGGSLRGFSARLARSARIHSPGAACGASAVPAESRAGVATHAHLPRQRHAFCPGVRNLLFLPG